MSSLNDLFAQRESMNEEAARSLATINAKIQKTLDVVYANCAELIEAVSDLETHKSVSYAVDMHGELTSFIRVSLLHLIPKLEREFFENYLADKSVNIDWDNGLLVQYLDQDNLIIRDDASADNGVWQENSLIIAQREYTVNREVNIALRNKLIVQHMDRTGCYPGIFRLTRAGAVFAVSV